jgi:hypothetical protein
MVFPFVDKGNCVKKTLIANDVYHPTATRFINIDMMEHLSVVILQDSA